jgi:hypothetical protein
MTDAAGSRPSLIDAPRAVRRSAPGQTRRAIARLMTAARGASGPSREDSRRSATMSTASVRNVSPVTV